MGPAIAVSQAIAKKCTHDALVRQVDRINASYKN